MVKAANFCSLVFTLPTLLPTSGGRDYFDKSAVILSGNVIATVRPR
jgi:hypothetical protein